MKIPWHFGGCGFLFVLAAVASAAETADVVVYGATPDGFCAAIGAAREGAKVLLVEPTGHVGGVNTGGLCFSDSNQTVRSTVMGLFDEWHRRVEADYVQRRVVLPYQVAVKDATYWTYEPHVAQRVTAEMLAEAKVEVRTKRPLLSVVKEGAEIRRIVTADGEFAARVFIDATYEGDLMAAAGVSWTIGREGKSEFGETLAGKRYTKGIMPIDGFGDDGKPLALITGTERGNEADGDDRVMVYSFRLCLTNDPANRVPMPQPKRYEASRFEVIRRYYKSLAAAGKSGAKSSGEAPVLWDLYPLPGKKFDANNGIGKPFSMGLVGACNGWSEGNVARRAELWEMHREYTLELYQFLTTDPAVPEASRRRLGELGLCRDEFVEHGHWSPQLYVREGRRMRGMYVLSEKDILQQPAKEEAIVVSSFPIDSHDCRRLAIKGEGVVNEGTIFPVRMLGRPHGYPYQVPYGAILPKGEECRNLLVPVALSSTHVAMSSIRVEPTWMILGQSAGIAAALAARERVAVQDVPYEKLRGRLVAQKQVLDLPTLPDLAQEEGSGAIDPKSLPGIVLDDAAAELTGAWGHSQRFRPYVGVGYAHDDGTGAAPCRAVFRFRVPSDGNCDLQMIYSAHASRGTRVPIVVRNGEHETKLTVDQTLPLGDASGGRKVGTARFVAGVESTITISNENAGGFVILDAVVVRLAGE